MVRRVFFSFHYSRDIWRVSQVRNSNVVQSSAIAEEGYIDSNSWEQLKRQGDQAVRNWINRQFKNTSVTVVLIGSETHSRKWVNYEIEKSIEKDKGLLGIRIHQLRNKRGQTDSRGPNPLDNHYVETRFGRKQPASSHYKTYDWVRNRGRVNIGNWVEEAAKLAGR